MSKTKKYNLNPDTLLYEVVKTPRKDILRRLGVYFLVSVGLTVFYFWLYVGVFGWDTPKTAHLKKVNAEWSSRMEVLNYNMDQYESALNDLEMRNEGVYRLIFGMNPIPEEVLNAGFGGVNRYAFLDGVGTNGTLKNTYVRLDVLTKRTFVESKSYDEVYNLSRQAGDMASCIPAIPPIVPDMRTYRISSSFGGRRDPVYGGYRHHGGVDFAMKPGNPVYATGDGVVETVAFQFFGYGNQIVIDHGFGYKTRYAHLKAIDVVEGMKVKRGECIGQVGNTGKSTGPHLHYEVLYRNKSVNPTNFYDLSMTVSEYKSMLKVREVDQQTSQRPKFSVKTK